MKIQAIHIYGYGKLTDVIINNLQTFQVFYGENEAGKSTIMSFIHSILFGFPTKIQTELRYEPKTGSKYGGRLTVHFHDRGTAIIERVKGKAAGDVNVLLDDGTRGGETLLNELLHDVDKQLFQSVFSFNIHGLQNVQHLKGEDLGKFLFSAAAIGTDGIVIAEQTLQKKLDERFKPNGNKPSINVQLKELQQLHNELKKAERENGDYWTKIQLKEKLENELDLLIEERTDKEGQLAEIREWEKIRSSFIQYQLLQVEAHSMETAHFPIGGLNRLDRLEAAMKPIEAQKTSIEARVHALKENIYENKPHAKTLEKENEIQAVIESIPVWERILQEKEERSIQLRSIDEELSILGEKLHIEIEEEKVRAIDTSVIHKEKVIKAVENQKKLHSKKMELDERFEEERNTLVDLEDKIEKVKSNLLTDEERTELLKKQTVYKDKKQIEQELQEIRERMIHLTNEQSRTRQEQLSNKRRDRFQFSFFTIMFACLVIWGLLNSHWFMAVIGSVGFVFSLYSILKKSPAITGDLITDELASLQEREQLRIASLSKIGLMENEDVEGLLTIDDERQSQYRHHQLLWQQSNDNYEKIIRSYEEWEVLSAEVHSEINCLGQKLNLPEHIVKSHLLEAFTFIEQVKALLREKTYLNERQILGEQKLTSINDLFNELNQLLDRKPAKIHEGAFLLRKKLKEEMEKQITQRERKEKLSELEAEWEMNHSKYLHYQQEVSALLAVTQAVSVEEFIKIGNLAEKKIALEGELQNLKLKVKMSSLTDERMKALVSIDNLSNIVMENESRLSHIEKEVPSLQRRLAETKYEITLIEDGGTYADILHTFKMKKAEFDEAAKEWATYATAKDILKRTVNRFKEEKLPKIVKAAERYFSLLTGERYKRVYLNQENGLFHIENKNGLIFEAKELSQATAEQLYISFRLGLAEIVFEKYAMPIIIDDSFVNFDQERTENVIRLFKSITGVQILFFTCQRHLMPYFSEEEVIEINHLTSMPSSF
ncbi:ATP-binding protein [Cytobacillus purgationiresistens]|uniref:Uncharacterized protein YhaN n=1 Tax=Cytobacillus purgationiresistens TaxID=863449 RepID=A0ABU0ACG8_9BACI|nr:AAA family ATPase [Cytobacillus purgationiresistens]MDQ0268946.1 uncharacterized protein YhaN [Cytobacillus purgationiresistens]